MALSDPWGHDGKTYDGKEMRQLVEAVGGHSGIAQTGGVLHGLKVTQQTSPATTVKMAAGNALIGASGAGLSGLYQQANDADLTSPAFTATSANGRKDRLILRVTSGVTALEIVQGTASGSPAEPTITGDNYLEIAMITLPGSTTNITDAMITDRRVFIGKWAQPWGEVASASGSNWTASSTGSAADIANATVTWVAVKNRRYKITLQGHVFSSVDGDIARLLLTTAANAAIGVPSAWDRVINGVTVADTVTAIAREVIAAAGSVTRKFRLQRVGGSGTCQFFSDATRLASIVVEDIGPSGAPD